MNPVAARKPGIALFAFVLLLSACGVGSHFSVDGPKPFRYEPPENTAEEVNKECDARAKSAARQAGYEYSSSVSDETSSAVAVLTGPFGALFLLNRVYEIEEEAYENDFEACLQEKGAKAE